MDENEKYQEVKNDSCILAQFVNEESNIEIGFLPWLCEEDASNIDIIISSKKEIVVIWPDCETICAPIMNSLLKTCKFKKHIVRLLAKGEWVEMRKKKKNFEIYGIISPSKEERRTIKKIAPRDDEISPKRPKKTEAPPKDLDTDLINKIAETSSTLQNVRYTLDDDDTMDSSNDENNEPLEAQKNSKNEIVNLKYEIDNLKTSLEIEMDENKQLKDEISKLKEEKENIPIKRNVDLSSILKNEFIKMRQIADNAIKKFNHSE